MNTKENPLASNNKNYKIDTFLLIVSELVDRIFFTMTFQKATVYTGTKF